MAAANKFSFMDILNAQSKADAKTAAVTEYTEIYLNPYDVEETESNFYSQESIEELADAILAVGQQQPTVLGRIDGKYKIISGHRRNKANRLLIDKGYEQYKSVRYLYKDITPAGLELSLLVGNAFNRELTPYEKTEQAARLKKALIRARDEDGLEIQGRLRNLIADVLGESATNVGRMEQINNNLTPEAKEQFKAGNLGSLRDKQARRGRTKRDSTAGGSRRGHKSKRDSCKGSRKESGRRLQDTAPRKYYEPML